MEYRSQNNQAMNKHCIFFVIHLKKPVPELVKYYYTGLVKDDFHIQTWSYKNFSTETFVCYIDNFLISYV